jgi:photosystem II stability/assembly factor-like uncharacterized protein
MQSVLYVGTKNGVTTFRRSHPDGEWTSVDANMPACSVSEIAFNPERPNVAYAATTGSGIFKTEDFGDTWSKPNYARRGPGNIRCLTIDPTNPERLLAGCEPIDVFVSEDSGKTWELMKGLWDNSIVPAVDFGGSPVAEPHVRDIAIDVHNSDVMYLALQVASIVKTTDGGKSWTHITDEIDRDVHTFDIDPNDSDHIVIATGGHDSRQGNVKGKAFYTTYDAGETWKPLAMNFAQDYSLPLVPKPGSPEVLYASLAFSTPGAWRRRPEGANGIMIKSKDNGETWDELNLTNIPNHSLSMVTAVSVDNGQPTSVVAGFASGTMITSDDDGDSWEVISPKVSGLSDLKFAIF